MWERSTSHKSTYHNDTFPGKFYIMQGQTQLESAWKIPETLFTEKVKAQFDDGKSHETHDT